MSTKATFSHMLKDHFPKKKKMVEKKPATWEKMGKPSDPMEEMLKKVKSGKAKV